MSNQIERYQAPSVSLYDDYRYMDRIPAMAEQFARSGLCPKDFRGKPDDVAIVAYSLADLGLRLTLNTLPQCYVIHGTVGYMAQLQMGLAGIHGFDIHPKTQPTNTEATVVVITPDGEQFEVTFTIDDAKQAGYYASNDMYKKIPKNMLLARAVTTAITWYCPEVRLGLVGTATYDPRDEVRRPAPPQRPVVEIASAPRIVDIPPAMGPDMVLAAAAKWELVEAYKEGGFDRETAIVAVRRLWEQHDLTSDPVPRPQLDGLLTLIRADQIAKEDDAAGIGDSGEPEYGDGEEPFDAA